MNATSKKKSVENEKLLTLTQAADFLKISKPTIYRLLDSGKIKGRKAGNQWRFKKEDLLAYLDQGPVSTVFADVPDEELLAELSILNMKIKKLGKEPTRLPTQPDHEGKMQALVSALLSLACYSRASDIHLEAFNDDRQTTYVFRLRVDGVLYEVRRYSKALAAGILAQLKTWMHIDLQERRPQDGRLKIKVDEHSLDLRSSFIPTVLGESAVFRILDPHNILLGLDHLGFVPEAAESIRAWARQPHGLILVTGPTGSGKTTLAYSILQEIASVSRKIMSIESPVELILPWVTQLQENTSIGLTYPAGVRSFLRQDPDVLYIAEIRDLETMTLALKAALVGHLVISVLHSEDTTSALTRMVEMGVEPFMITAALHGIVATRLIRKVCPACGIQHSLSMEALVSRMDKMASETGFKVPRKPDFLVGKGCPECHGHGFQGRQGICEVMTFSQGLKEDLLHGEGRAALRHRAIKEGMVTLLGDGIRKASQGLTPLEEVFRVFALEDTKA